MTDTDWLGCLILPKTQEEARAFMIRETSRMVIYFAAKVVVGSPTPEDIERHDGAWYLKRGEANQVCVFQWTDGSWWRQPMNGVSSPGHRTAELAMCGLTAAEVGE